MTEHTHIDDSHWHFPALSEHMTLTRGHQGGPGTSLSITWQMFAMLFLWSTLACCIGNSGMGPGPEFNKPAR